MKTNAARLLDTLAIDYQILTYPVDPNNLVASATADKLGLPHDQVFKTLVIRGDRHGICLAVLAANAQLDLKALAKLTCDRKLAPVALKDVQPLTGYIRGGVTALACKKSYPTYVDEWIEAYDHIAVSAGMRGAMLWLSPQDYIKATQATVGRIITEGSPAQ
ncbi:MAG: Cys-tRNA(Pro) deacylase [Cyanobacteria bacterium J06656_5]